MAIAERAWSAQPQSTAAPAVEVVVPVLDEIGVLAASVRRLHAYLLGSFPFTFRITIADNGSSDGTWEEAQALAAELPHVHAVRLGVRGRGGALRKVWSESDAAVLSYMDVDLSTDLSALLPLVAPLLSGHSDLAIGSRLKRDARVVRGPKRELISRCYNVLLHAVLRARFSDAQCGFKAIRADRARQLLPLVEDRGWFFDTELLVRAERMGMRIHEVPVDWVDDPDSRVDIVATALADLRGVARLVRDLGRDRAPIAAALSSEQPPSFGVQALRFGAIGVVSTLAYIALFIAFRSVVTAQTANAAALLATAVANTAANRRFTFAVRGRVRAARHQAQGLVVFALALALTAGCLALLRALDPHASRVAELTVLVGANLAATVLRFILLRGWVFRARRAAPILEQGDQTE
ncbi:MAG: glycosyl transferase [Actinomycetia bacterium]|jgi:putative flippase GtrA|nr:glycosyl transferase [Actinomycetes bacterium]